MYKDTNEPSVLGGVVLIYYKEINSNNPLTISIIYRHLLFSLKFCIYYGRLNWPAPIGMWSLPCGTKGEEKYLHEKMGIVAIAEKPQ